MTKTVFPVSLVLALAVTLASAEERKATLTTADSAELPLSTRVTPVAITNPVDADGNLRVVEQSTQPRQVEVVNLPATQEVTGQVNVANLPLDASGNLRVSIARPWAATKRRAINDFRGSSTSTLSRTTQILAGNVIPGPRMFRFVGVTTQTFVGNAGRAAMTTACAAQYPGSRMAFADEYATTPNPPPIPGTAWIQPRPIIELPNRGDGFPRMIMDSAGNLFSLLAGFDCASWRTAAGDANGGVVTPSGAIYGDTVCSNSLAVACAAPE